MAIRITILIKKIDSLSTEEFHKYWSEVHPGYFLSVPSARKFLLRYSQYHIDAKTTAEVRAATDVARGAIDHFDGAAEFWVEKFEDFTAIFQDEKYLRDVVPDEKRFLARDQSVLIIGGEEVKWENGKLGPGVTLQE